LSVRALGAAAKGAGPATLPQDRGDLGGHLARSPRDIRPVVAQGDDARACQVVVAVDVLPPGLGPVRGEAVEFDGKSELLVEVVQIGGPGAASHAGLTARARQPMRPLDVPQILTLQAGQDSSRNLRQSFEDVSAPAQPGAADCRFADLLRSAEAAATCCA
jgi:hypothetical protein